MDKCFLIFSLWLHLQDAVQYLWFVLQNQFFVDEQFVIMPDSHQ
ncbi:unnamed protein product [Bacillus thuringiensis DB27]|uniref:Uncharacterized protein n=1 Tax=Bacillus thuringiensis DB27 TaxID=1431339 RepID=W8YD41_BACTU|nr:unnamed protein product [Bacillus thuringiensis DB27]